MKTRSSRWARVGLCGSLLVAASVHLLLVGDHAEESPLLGAGFVAAGILQVGLASVVTVNRARLPYYLVIGLNVSLIVVYAVHVLVGLPLSNSPDGSLALGPRENIDVIGAVSKIAELAGIVLALGLLRSPDGRTAEYRRAPGPGRSQEGGTSGPT